MKLSKKDAKIQQEIKDSLKENAGIDTVTKVAVALGIGTVVAYSVYSLLPKFNVIQGTYIMEPVKEINYIDPKWDDSLSDCSKAELKTSVKEQAATDTTP